jgi:hypothetical protein
MSTLKTSRALSKPFSNGGNPWATWWRFSPGFLITFGVGVMIVVFDPHALVSFVKICLSLTTFPNKIVVYSRLHEFHSTLILSFLSARCLPNVYVVT